MKKLRIALIFGGLSSEHEVSIRSARTIYAGLKGDKYEVVPFGIGLDGRWLSLFDSQAVLDNTDQKRAQARTDENFIGRFIEMAQSPDASVRLDAAFPIVHGTFGEDGSLQGLFRLVNIPYVGPDVLGSAVCMDKDVAKRLLLEAGIPCAPFECIHSHKINEVNVGSIVDRLRLPLFIKPANQGSSVGVCKVTTAEQLVPALKNAAQFDRKIIIEKFIKGREIECSVMGNERPEAAVPGEIIPGAEFYSYDAKYSSASQSETRIPADLNKEVAEQIRVLAVRCFEVLGCEGMARVDFFVEDSNKIWLNEVNTIPGFTSISMYPKMWEAAGVSLSALLDKLVTLAIARNRRDAALKLSPA
jgi:D-alanine-D-alanine ligase